MPTPTSHPTLDRQLRRLGLDASAPPATPATWAAFLGRVGAAYTEADAERHTAERSMAVSTAELRELNDDLVAAFAAKAELMATMSHEIRTPLNGVIGMADLLLAGEGLTERQRRYAGLIKGSAEALTELINDALDLSKAEAGKMELEAVDFDLAAVVEDVAELFAARAAGKGVQVAADVGVDVRRAVSGDPHRLRQVLANLLSNAVKFTAAGHVLIRCAADGDLTRFEVADTGPGMSPETIGKLFTSFAQADVATARKFGGTGLGLAICKQLAELMGGAVGVTSTVGQGSTFWATARLRPAQAMVVARPAFTGVAAAVDVVDRLTADILTARLRDWSVRIDPAAADPVRFVTGLPDRAGPRTIAIVGSSVDVTAEHRRRSGVAAVVTTPLRLDQLAAAITTALSPTPGAVAAAGPADTSQCDASQCRTARLLVADDQDVNRMVVTDMLAQLGFRSDAVADGRAAVAAVLSAAVPYDLVLMDCQMPELDGYAATRAIRADEAAQGRRRLPIVALTGRATPEDARAATEAGMDGHCAKPIDRPELIAVIERLLGRVQPDAARVGPAPIAIDPVPPAGPDPIDVPKVLSRCGGKPSLVARVLGQFVTQAEAAVATITSATDPSVAGRAAHGLKGSAGMISADLVRAAAAAIEAAGTLPAVRDVERLRVEVDRCAAFVRRVVPTLSAAPTPPGRTEAA